MHNTCLTCLFFNPAPVQDNKTRQIGNCHFNPPATNLDPFGKQKLAFFPLVLSEFWCGGWEPKQEME
jgi:hypothetical protein